VKISLDLHDFSIIRNRFDLLLTLKDHYPELKVSLFTVPYDYMCEMSDLRLMKDEALKKIQENKDWLEFIPHGIAHIPREFEKADRETMETYVNNIIPEMVKAGLPEDRIVKGFCPPQWLWNQEVIDVLDEHRWWGATDRNQPGLPSTKRYYTYSHSINEPYWLSTQDTIKLHGHIGLPDKNNLQDCLLKLLKLPVHADWKFVSEMVEGGGK